MEFLIRDRYVINVLDKIQRSLITKYRRNVTKKEASIFMAKSAEEKMEKI